MVLNQLMLLFAKCKKKKWDIFDNHSKTSSDSDETGSYSSADKHSEIEPLRRLYFIKFRKLMYYTLTF